jgi:hypothetical protein
MDQTARPQGGAPGPMYTLTFGPAGAAFTASCTAAHGSCQLPHPGAGPPLGLGQANAQPAVAVAAKSLRHPRLEQMWRFASQLGLIHVDVVSWPDECRA